MMCDAWWNYACAVLIDRENDDECDDESNESELCDDLSDENEFKWFRVVYRLHTKFFMFE